MKFIIKMLSGKTFTEYYSVNIDRLEETCKIILYGGKKSIAVEFLIIFY